jgi:hypothetical protein
VGTVSEVVLFGAAIAVADTNNVAPKIAGLTTKDFHKILDLLILFSSHLVFMGK